MIFVDRKNIVPVFFAQLNQQICKRLRVTKTLQLSLLTKTIYTSSCNGRAKKQEKEGFTYYPILLLLLYYSHGWDYCCNRNFCHTQQEGIDRYDSFVFKHIIYINEVSMMIITITRCMNNIIVRIVHLHVIIGHIIYFRCVRN